MINPDRARDLIGAPAYDTTGDKIGTIRGVFVDNTTDQPEWIAVRAGLLSATDVLAPLADAVPTNDGGVCLAVTKDQARGRRRSTPTSRSSPPTTRTACGGTITPDRSSPRRRPMRPRRLRRPPSPVVTR